MGKYDTLTAACKANDPIFPYIFVEQEINFLKVKKACNWYVKFCPRSIQSMGLQRVGHDWANTHNSQSRDQERLSLWNLSRAGERVCLRNSWWKSPVTGACLKCLRLSQVASVDKSREVKLSVCVCVCVCVCSKLVSWPVTAGFKQRCDITWLKQLCSILSWSRIGTTWNTDEAD